MLAHAAAILLFATAADPEAQAPVEPPVEAQPQAQAQLSVPTVAPAPLPAPSAPLDPPFLFGSYGRLQLGWDLADRPGRPVNVVGHGPRLVEDSYEELNFYYRIMDPRGEARTDVHLVTALGFSEDLFHYNGKFSASIAVRNLYIEVGNLFIKDLGLWFGSRMYRGDDLYLLDFWPLDNLNTLGGGLTWRYRDLQLDLAVGANRLDNSYQLEVLRAPSTDGQGQQWFAMERQRTIVSLRGTYPVGPVQLRAYLERHDLPAGQRTNPDSGELQALPRDSGWVVGAQVSGAHKGLSGMLVAKYCRGLGAFGDLTVPYGFSLDRSVTSASLTVVAAGVSYEHSRFALPVAAYFASFRDATGLDVNGRNYEEVVLDARPTVYAHDILHIALDVSYQLRAPHTLTPDGSRPIREGVWQIGIMPMIVPGGAGLWTRPAIRLIYAVRVLSQDARNDLFATEDPRNGRAVSQFIGAGVEWWFNSSYR